MEYRDMLIYLNILGLTNLQINNVEKYIVENDLNIEVLFNLENNDLTKRYISTSAYEKIKKGNVDILSSVKENAEKNNIEILTYKDKDFPERLNPIENSPKVIYAKGKIKIEDNISIGVVGSRKHTDYGEMVVNYFVDELVKLGVTIVSGMAYGIDTIAHKRALKNNGRTIAVLGNGVDVIYPIKNSKLYMNIINNGAVVGEYPLGTQSLPYNFPARNRIISGLSLGVIIAEARDNSGSLITARVAAEQGKEIFAVPGNINSLYSEGTNKLIRDGAIPLMNIDDILLGITEIQNNANVKKEKEKLVVNLTNEEKIIYDLILSGIKDINNICIYSDFDISYLNSILTILELKELIESKNNKDFYILD